ncbi:MAG: hypothetical protein KAJ47_02020 [Candidatus Aenigmarchaeota archaeon]|nr:hypothetical protein [Candidatus Aenigmarchaeota archaeon]
MEEKSTFVEFFGDYPLIRVLDFLITYEDFDYNKKDISKNANVAWNTLEIFWNKLVDQNIVIKTRKVGKSDMFKLNKENPVVHELIELDKKLMLDSIESENKKVLIDA